MLAAVEALDVEGVVELLLESFGGAGEDAGELRDLVWEGGSGACWPAGVAMVMSWASVVARSASSSASRAPRVRVR